MAYSDRELIARIVQCEARRRRRQWNESSSKCDFKENMQEYHKVVVLEILFSNRAI